MYHYVIIILSIFDHYIAKKLTWTLGQQFLWKSKSFIKHAFRIPFLDLTEGICSIFFVDSEFNSPVAVAYHIISDHIIISYHIIISHHIIISSYHHHIIPYHHITSYHHHHHHHIISSSYHHITISSSYHHHQCNLRKIGQKQVLNKSVSKNELQNFSLKQIYITRFNKIFSIRIRPPEPLNHNIFEESL